MHQHVFAQRVQSWKISIPLMRGRKNDRFQFTLSVCVNKAHLRIIQFSQLARASKLFRLLRSNWFNFVSSLSEAKGVYIMYMCIVRLFTSRRGQWVRTQPVHRVDPLSADCWMSEWARWRPSEHVPSRSPCLKQYATDRRRAGCHAALKPFSHLQYSAKFAHKKWFFLLEIWDANISDLI